MEAFGAFAEKTEIDFRLLTQNALLLIHGPTGSGKTTIFDALCFALYGKSSGGRLPEEMRSDHVDENSITFVSFTFEVPSGLWRATREFRPSRGRQDYTLRQRLEHLGSDLEPDKEPLTRTREVNEMVAQVIGLTFDQFSRIVMLPQGEFQKLLLADTKEKQPILEKLFHASLYSRLTAELGNIAAQLEVEHKTLKQQIRAILDANNVSDLGTMQGRSAELEREEKRMLDAEPLVRVSRDRAITDMQSAEQLQELFSSARAARTDLEHHMIEKPALLEKESRVKNARLAAPFEPRLNGLAKMKIEVDDRERNLNDEKIAWNTALAERERCHETLSAAKVQEAKIEELQREKSRLEDAVPAVRGLAAAETLVRDVQTAFRRILGDRTRAEEVLQIAESEEGMIIKQVADLKSIGAGLSGLEVEARLLESIQINHRSYVREQENHVQFTKAAEKAGRLAAERTKQSEAASAILRQKEQEWAKHQASVLAAGLKLGEPCPVCGSLEHPSPASTPGIGVSDADLETLRESTKKAEENRRKAETECHSAKTQCDLCEERIRGLREQLGDFSVKSSAAVAEARREKESTRDAAKSAQETTATLEKRLVHLRSEKTSAAEDRERLTGELEKIGVDKTRLETELKLARKSLPDGMKDELGIRNRIGFVDNAIGAIRNAIASAQTALDDESSRVVQIETTIRNKGDELNRLLGSLTELREILIADAVRSGYANIEAIARSILPEAEIEKLDAQVSAWKNRELQLETTCRDSTRRTEGKVEPDVEKARKQANEAQSVWDIHQQRRSSVKTELGALSDQITKVAGMEADLNSAGSAAAQARGIADIASGANNLRQPFQAFVLSVFLDEVIACANQRLLAMSRSRYELVRRTEADDRRKKVGLDLDVFDNNTGESRQVRTLSGGEQFFTSLALALGMADAALRHTGGVRLDALFVDEGFGSLDSETLDMAICSLTDLQANGRLVGIISHVEELRDRIPVRLEVLKGRTGSRVKWHL